MEVRFGCIGDVHEGLDRLEEVVAFLSSRGLDGVLMVGDFAYGAIRPYATAAADSPAAAAIEVVESLDVPTLFVPGNHDEPHQPLAGNIDGSVEEVAGVRIAGIGGSGPRQFGFPYEWTDEEARARSIPERDILLAHAPPARTGLDRLSRSGDHAGSEAIRELAERTSGALVCGHIHEGAGAELVNRCLCYNIGSLGEPFARTQVGVLEFDRETKAAAITHFDLEAGTTWTK